MISRLACAVQGLGGWRRRLLLVALGVLATLALAPYYLVVLLVPALTGLLWLIAAAETRRAAFGAGWWFGVGHCGLGYYWISHSLTVDAARHGWLVPIAVVGFAAAFGLYPAVAAWALDALRRFRARAGGGATGAVGGGTVLAFAGIWVLTEWLRGWLFTGFPWNLLGTAWAFSDAMIQPAALAGIYGLSLATVAAAAAPATLAHPAGGRTRWAPAVLAVLLIASLFVYGTIRLDDAARETAFVKDVRLRLVQPNIDQKTKWRNELRAGHVDRQREMSLKPPAAGRPGPTHVIWAETAAPYILNRQPGLIAALADAAPVSGALVTGSLRVEAAGEGEPRVYNSLFVIEPSGRVAAQYDKAHLVPLGEYVPFYEWLGFLKVTVGRGNFTPGPGLVTLDIRGLPPAVPLICYEVIFPGAVVPREGPRPRWLLNVTNDAWFGTSAGPHQHFAAARFRAVEEGLPLVRVANTGISAIVDPFGRVAASLGLGQSGVIDGGLPAALETLPLFARVGNALALLLAGLSLVLGGFLIGRSRQ